MKNKKLKLNDLKVQSFVTSLQKGEVETVKGGTGNTNNPVCNSDVPACDTHAAACDNTQAVFCGGGGSALCTVIRLMCIPTRQHSCFVIGGQTICVG